jgi:hypothetical protein
MNTTIVALPDGLEIRVKPTNFYTRHTCFFCGCETNKDGVLAEVYHYGDRTGYVVCPDYPAKRGCISQPPDVLVNHLRDRAARLRAQADSLRALADAGMPNLSGLAQTYRDVEALHEAEWAADVQAASEWGPGMTAGGDDLPVC